MESFSVGKIREGQTGVNGQKYLLVDIKYALNTEAGFLINRKGTVALTSVGPYIQALVAVTTDKRYKKLESSIRDIADSFRIYKLQSGIFATE